MQEKNIWLSDYGKDILQKTEFSKSKETYDLVQFTVEQLGFPQGATTAEIWGTEDDKDEHGNPAPFTKGKMTELGLDLCPAEVGPLLRLVYKGTDWKLIAMQQISGRGGSPFVFSLGADDDWLRLHAYCARPSFRWSGSHQFVFRSRKLES